MYFLFIVPIVSFALILSLSIAPIFSFNRPRPMLEQIEESRRADRAIRHMENTLEYEMSLIGD